MTVAAWLEERTPAPPARLTARIAEALGDARSAPRSATAASCLDAAGRMLARLLAEPATGRESALDLLTVDALVTYAFEAASDDPATVVAIASEAARRFAAAAGE